MCKLYLRFIHGKDATFENILTKNLAHGRSKIVAQSRYDLVGLVFFKAPNLGEDVCGLHGAKYARTFGCLITFFLCTFVCPILSAKCYTGFTMAEVSVLCILTIHKPTLAP